jgi:hypothetical protein
MTLIVFSVFAGPMAATVFASAEHYPFVSQDGLFDLALGSALGCLALAKVASAFGDRR